MPIAAQILAARKGGRWLGHSFTYRRQAGGTTAARRSIKLPAVPRAPGTNAKRRTGWLGRLVGRRPLALQFSLPCAARNHSQQGRLNRAGSDSPGTEIAGHRPYSANTASKARIATSFFAAGPNYPNCSQPAPARPAPRQSSWELKVRRTGLQQMCATGNGNGLRRRHQPRRNGPADYVRRLRHQWRRH